MARKTLDPHASTPSVPGKVSEREAQLAGSGIDPNLLAMLAKKKHQAELSTGSKKSKKVYQREPAGSALKPRGMPIDPRQRAAMMMQQKLQGNMEETTGRKKKKKKKKKVLTPNV